MARGGTRKGAGRPSVGTKQVTVRLSDIDHQLLRTLGTSTFLRQALDAVRTKKMTFKLDLNTLTDEQKEAFSDAFYRYAPNDIDSDNPNPWGCPWCFENEIEVTGTTPAEWAEAWWEQNRNEIDSITPLFVFEKASNSWSLDVTNIYDFRKNYDIENYQDWRGQGGTLEDVMDFIDKEDALNFIEMEFDEDQRQELIEMIEEA